MTSTPFFHYTLIGDSGVCPDGVLVLVNPGDGSGPTLQRTLYRKGDGETVETEAAFWQRIVEAAQEFGYPLGWKSNVVIICKYDAVADPQAEEKDARVNYIRTLSHVAKHDPSHKLRVHALCQLADLYWPELRGMTQ